jgi:HAMP domain-containing protein
LNDSGDVTRAAGPEGGRLAPGAPGAPDGDRLAELAERLSLLEVAHEARSRRLAVERMVFAEHVNSAADEIAALKEEIARMREEYRRQVEHLQAHARSETAAREKAEAELQSLRATRTFRYTAELRMLYGRFRGLLGTSRGRRPT